MSSIAFLACLLLAACVSAPKPKASAPLPEYEGPVTVATLTDNEFTHVVNSVRSEIKGSALSTNGKSTGFDGAFVFMAPDRLRVRLYGALGTTLADLLNSNGELQIYDPANSRMYIGPPILGNATSAIPPTVSRLEDKVFMITYTQDAEGNPMPETVYVFESRTLRNIGMVLYSDAQVFAELTFDEFAGRVPGKAKIALAHGPVIEFDLIEPELNSPIPEKFFNPVDRDGLDILPLEALGTFR